MPYRKFPLVPGEVYHVFNRSIARKPVFLNHRDYERATEVIYFYSFSNPGLRFSHYNRLSQKERKIFMTNLRNNKSKQIQLLAFCIMPNHIHFLLRGIMEKGISTFMTNFQHSYAKYFNSKNKRTGSLFQSMFKAVRVETDEQLQHVARYIHLNPLTSYIVKSPEQLENYPWSSFIDYVEKRENDLVSLDTILSSFSSREKFKKFTLDQAAYQRKIDEIKHLLLE